MSDDFLNAPKLHTDYALIQYVSTIVIPEIDASSLAIVSIYYSDQIRRIEFSDSGWRITTRSGTTKMIYRSQISEGGDFSVIVFQGYYDEAWDIELVLVSGCVSVKATKFSLSESPSALSLSNGAPTSSRKLGRKARAEGQKMNVRFSGQWETVEDDPEIIFEAASVDDIAFVDSSGETVAAPSSIKAVTRVAEPLPLADPPAKKPESKGLSGGVIAAIVIAVVVVVAGAAVAVWFFVLRPKADEEVPAS
jgi:hypothetical protein